MKHSIVSSTRPRISMLPLGWIDRARFLRCQICFPIFCRLPKAHSVIIPSENGSCEKREGDSLLAKQLPHSTPNGRRLGMELMLERKMPNTSSRTDSSPECASSTPPVSEGRQFDPLIYYGRTGCFRPLIGWVNVSYRSGRR